MDKSFILEVENGIEDMSQDIKGILYSELKNERFISAVKDELMKGIKISFVIMTYNEERVIERCIRSIENIADEIIVLDTGSNDRTIEIIRNNFSKVKIYYETLKEDFSHIRNKLTLYAKNNWVFQIDADEYFENIQIDKYIAIFENINIEPKIISPILKNHDGTEIKNTRRLYKKNKSLKYHGRVHEELRYDSSANTPFIIIKADYYHDGYQEEVIKSKNKYERNIKLLKKMINEELDNPRWYYFLAREMNLSNCEDKLIKPIIKKGLEHATKKNKEYIIGLLELYMKVNVYNYDYELLFEYISSMKIEDPRCMDVYYYKLLIMNFRMKETLYSENTCCIEEITNLIEPYSCINQEGDHIFCLWGWNYFLCGRIDLAFMMWKKIQSTDVIEELMKNLISIKDKIMDFFENI